jgi:hypothetical protein
MASSAPKMSSFIRGIFYKCEEHNKKTFYHFILPNIYHNNNNFNHSIRVLEHYDQYVIKYFYGNDESKLDKLIVDNNIHTAKIHKPIYRENSLVRSNDIKYTTFKCRSQSNLDLIVGLEYSLEVDCRCGNFINNETHENVTYWTIYINEIKEVTKLE